MGKQVHEPPKPGVHGEAPPAGKIVPPQSGTGAVKPTAAGDRPRTTLYLVLGIFKNAAHLKGACTLRGFHYERAAAESDCRAKAKLSATEEYQVCEIPVVLPARFAAQERNP
jgi:hypothetical protein